MYFSLQSTLKTQLHHGQRAAVAVRQGNGDHHGADLRGGPRRAGSDVLRSLASRARAAAGHPAQTAARVGEPAGEVERGESAAGAEGGDGDDEVADPTAGGRAEPDDAGGERAAGEGREGAGRAADDDGGEEGAEHGDQPAEGERSGGGGADRVGADGRRADAAERYRAGFERDAQRNAAETGEVYRAVQGGQEGAQAAEEGASARAEGEDVRFRRQPVRGRLRGFM